MGKAKELTDIERSQIDILRRANPNWTQKAIAEEIGRSPVTVCRYLNDPENYGRGKRPGQPKKTTKREDRLICQKAREQKMSLSQIKGDLDLVCSRTTIWNRLVDSPNMAFGKHKSKPPLTATAKKRRLDFAIEHLTWPQEKWDNVIWTDEKRWCLDEPDGLRSYWYDLRSEKTIFSKRHSGGGNIQIWAGMSASGLTPLVFTTNKMDSDQYQDILASNLLPNGPLITDGEWIFMQDNAPPHRSASTQSWLSANGVTYLDWPPYSPDLNPIENLWGWLVRKVYSNGKQYRSISELKSALERNWTQIPEDLLRSLVFSIRDRLVKVVQVKGGSINY